MLRRTVTLDSTPNCPTAYIYELVYEFKSIGRGRPSWIKARQHFSEFGNARANLNNMVNNPIYRNVEIKVLSVILGE